MNACQTDTVNASMNVITIRWEQRAHQLAVSVGDVSGVLVAQSSDHIT